MAESPVSPPFSYEFLHRFPRIYPFSALMPVILKDVANGGDITLVGPSIQMLTGTVAYSQAVMGEDFTGPDGLDPYYDANTGKTAGMYGHILDVNLQAIALTGQVGIGLGVPDSLTFPLIDPGALPFVRMEWDSIGSRWQIVTCVGDGATANHITLLDAALQDAIPAGALGPVACRVRLVWIPGVRADGYVNGVYGGSAVLALPDFSLHPGANKGACVHIQNGNAAPQSNVYVSNFSVQMIGYHG